ncbi:Regulator of chromosome condensation (RCC1) family with FYVE zinc finger domain isoform 3 [Hibiscus syriacus]|uniref:Regulator of chromosome condensation (RCC1) family with FYVE zinc finger domain isoform 3 n=2 Tax=Hibiscus syriacus TaxID=106335 RepID=A0A6A3BB86_HIBSY|nr:PH, RCC1 and FYVE domains-containing protein 1-like isoform X1 [Hibiscus syriacus]KAE8714300.1 Regulator of chromosome condensation (RCC1) family with FYVE zinc finger domain isoform 3 [Hibiscus syriacus]
MADLVSYGNAQRYIDQALIALKKGAQLLKYGRKGKPKFCPFRLSNDEASLIWISSSGERSLKLALVSKIIPGQRTAVFQRYLRPEKDYLSFSLIYNNGKRSLDLICKDKVEAEVWIAGLKALISSGQGGRSKIDGWNDGGLYLDDGRDLTSNSASDSSVSATRDISSPEVFVSFNPNTSPKSLQPENSFHSERLHAASEGTNMDVKGSSSYAFRVSVSSAPSTSSHGSAPDDYDALGDVYIWGEVICDNAVKVVADKNANYLSMRADVLLPRPLECNVVLDVHHVACGVKHAALVTRQGEVFTWGEESGGRLGHGVGKDVIQPYLVESLAVTSVDFVACGEFHTCAVTMAGELYTWGDGTHNAGLLGHGTDVSHWIPKRISGPLEGLQVASVTCGPWHTALITSTGQLFTFGDGTFGVLGHGDRESVPYPREVESLSGLRTIAVGCGVWHTAAVVEVIVSQSSASVSSGKLFTWGDGDKNRLGHGDKEPRLKPTCVPALIDYNFHKVACGHSLTVGLTTSGQVFTMGSTVYGQLGIPYADGKIPSLVEDKLSGECAEEIACGAYHVAVLTSSNEVYTWGKGANGRLGHGDVEDRKTPTLVEGLKDRHVKFIACGSNYSAAICLHKWVSGAEQSQCSACRQAFGFTRKRHNCYNCGLVHCHSCSSKKAPGAALAPNPGKPYRVCDSCFAKLNKVSEASNNRKNSGPRLSGENKDRLDKAEIRLTKSATPSNMDLIKQLDSKAAKQGKKSETFSLVRSTQAPSLLQLKDVVLFNAVDSRRTLPKPILTGSGVSSRSVSPFSRRPSPPRSATPVPTTSGLSFSKSIADSLKKTNELLNQEALKLRSQVETLRKRCELQEVELKKSTKRTQEAMTLAAEESAKSRAAKEVIKSLTAQLKDMAERLPPGVYDTENIKPAYLPNGLEPNGVHYPDANGEGHLRSDSIGGSFLASPIALDSTTISGTKISGQFHREPTGANGGDDHSVARLLNGSGSVAGAVDERESGSFGDGENGMNSRTSALVANGNQVEAEWIEQYEPGVYITLVALRDGTRDLKRVRFSRRRFGEHQAETWWSENREKVYERYNVNVSVSGQTARRSEGALSPTSQV